MTDRREFLKHLALGVAAITIARRLPAMPSPTAPPILDRGPTWDMTYSIDNGPWILAANGLSMDEDFVYALPHLADDAWHRVVILFGRSDREPLAAEFSMKQLSGLPVLIGRKQAEFVFGPFAWTGSSFRVCAYRQIHKPVTDMVATFDNVLVLEHRPDWQYEWQVCGLMASHPNGSDPAVFNSAFLGDVKIDLVLPNVPMPNGRAFATGFEGRESTNWAWVDE